MIFTPEQFAIGTPLALSVIALTVFGYTVRLKRFRDRITPNVEAWFYVTVGAASAFLIAYVLVSLISLYDGLTGA